MTTIQIYKLVCSELKQPISKCNSTSRKKELVQVRQISMYFAKKYTKDSLKTIGETVGNRDHATALHSYKLVLDLLSVDKQFRNIVLKIESKILLMKGLNGAIEDDSKLIERLTGIS